jgi:hypothetical protein
MPLGTNTIPCATHNGREITRDTIPGRRRVPTEKDHGNERLVAAHKKVYQKVLVHPVDLSKYAPNAIPLHGVFDASARRKAYLQRDVMGERRTRDDPVHKPHASLGLRRHISTAPIEKRSEQPTALKPVRRRKRGTPIGVVPI